MNRCRAPCAADLCHPLPAGAVLLLALNDHWLKGAHLLPGWLTGKISDVTSFLHFGIDLHGALAWVRSR